MMMKISNTAFLTLYFDLDLSKVKSFLYFSDAKRLCQISRKPDLYFEKSEGA